ncbi:type II secretion system F family protein [Edaphobacter sp. HDX4]
MNLIFYLAIGSSLFCGLSLIASLAMTAHTRAVKARVFDLSRQPAADIEPKEQLEGKLFAAIRTLRARIGMSENPRLQARFVAAGVKSDRATDTYFSAQMLGPIVGIVAGSFITTNTLFWIMVLVVVAYMAPDFILDRKIKSRRERIRRSIPDSIDLLVICVDAGLGLDQAILRVGQELAVSHPEINEEFLQINREQRAGKPRLEAWKSMAERTKLPDVEGFVNMLIQTERFGTPIARALSAFADAMRLKRRQIAEEKAAKTTVKIIFPLVLFIFPCMFIVLLGPAIISMMRNMSDLVK